MKKVEAGMFEMDKITCLATDWSKEGVGFFMFQKNCDCRDIKIGCCNEGWQVVILRITEDEAIEAIEVDEKNPTL